MEDAISRLMATEQPIPFDAEKDVFIRIVGGDERDQWEEYVETARKDEARASRSALYAKLVVLAFCDKKGTPLFKPGQEPEVARRLNHKLLKRMFDKALEVNRIGEEGVEAEKKGSAAAETSASGSSSPAASE